MWISGPPALIMSIFINNIYTLYVCDLFQFLITDRSRKSQHCILCCCVPAKWFLNCFEFAGTNYHYKLNTHLVYSDFGYQQIHILSHTPACTFASTAHAGCRVLDTTQSQCIPVGLPLQSRTVTYLKKKGKPNMWSQNINNSNPQ